MQIQLATLKALMDHISMWLHCLSNGQSALTMHGKVKLVLRFGAVMLVCAVAGIAQ
jgi:uncharacterized membrane protein (UPF0182 family)